MIIECRPIDVWPGEFTRPINRRRSQFSAGFGDTLDLLKRELGHLSAQRVVIEIEIAQADIRNDGWPRAKAKVPPPVKLSFTSKHGPLVYATDVFDHWADNLRAIALGLEALRKVDRYGITDVGQQYAGFAALPPAGPQGDCDLRAMLAAVAGVTGALDMDDKTLVRRARMASHPDHGGDPDVFAKVQAAAAQLAA